MATSSKKWSKATTFWESCRHAWQGIKHTFRAEKNFRIQFVSLIAVLLIGWWKDISQIELAMIVMVATMVLAFELVNTAMEMLADVVQPKYHDMVGRLKDISAAAVLIASVAAVMVGVLVFVG